MSAPTGLVSFRPNLLHNYHDQSEKVPFRPGVFQGYQVKSWYLPAEEDAGSEVEKPGDNDLEPTNPPETGEGEVEI